jgi:carbohydrate-selective porin OprB
MARTPTARPAACRATTALPGPEPLNRSELYQLWYRQTFLEDRFVFRIGTFFQPAVSYIPTPGASAHLGGAWALTFRLAVLF